MTVYHGSTVPVEKPGIRKTEAFLDFGAGFYTTASYFQAERWAKIKMRRLNTAEGFVSVYDFDYESAKKDTEILRFLTANEEWLKFVVANRNGEIPFQKADLVIGPVADDNVYRSIRLFETGVLDAEETVKRLKTEVLQDQWTFCSEKILSYLTFTESKKITGTESV
ncbi:MAG: DUF3990 domain-containing protein [Clostridia bacterium]|nr:DUF3990 domain-containing protein [Clostridia bacterium]